MFSLLSYVYVEIFIRKTSVKKVSGGWRTKRSWLLKGYKFERNMSQSVNYSSMTGKIFSFKKGSLFIRGESPATPSNSYGRSTISRDLKIWYCTNVIGGHMNIIFLC